MSSGFIIAVWSPKGGVGKTLLAASIGLQLAQKQRTVVVDGNPDNPDMTIMLQSPGNPSICNWPGTVKEGIEEHLVRRSSRLFLLPGPARYVDEGVLTKDLMESALCSLRDAGMAVVVDLSCGLRDSTLISLLLADCIVIPVTLDLLSIIPLVRLGKEQGILDLPRAKFRVVVNRHTDTREITAEDIHEHAGCPVVGAIPSSRAAASAINLGNYEAALGPSSSIGKALGGFLSELLPVATR